MFTSCSSKADRVDTCTCMYFLYELKHLQLFEKRSLVPNGFHGNFNSGMQQFCALVVNCCICFQGSHGLYRGFWNTVCREVQCNVHVDELMISFFQGKLEFSLQQVNWDLCILKVLSGGGGGGLLMISVAGEVRNLHSNSLRLENRCILKSRRWTVRKITMN